jgi:hypothetical protein
MALPDRITSVLAPHLGEHSADAVARHICAKYGLSETAAPERMAELREFLRRGLVVFVGASAAEALAEECVRDIAPPRRGAS